MITKTGRNGFVTQEQMSNGKKPPRQKDEHKSGAAKQTVGKLAQGRRTDLGERRRNNDERPAPWTQITSPWKRDRRGPVGAGERETDCPSNEPLKRLP